MNFDIKKLSAEKIFISLIIVSLAFENFRLFTVLGASFKPIHAIAAAAIIYFFFFKKITFKKVVGSLLFLVIPLLPFYRINDTREFIKTYVIYAMMVLFITLVLPHLKEEFKEGFSGYYRLFNNVIVIVCVLGIVQFILMNAFGIMFLDGVFGRFQFHYNNYGQQAGFYRAYSIFHEPSYFGWVLDIALAINLVIKDDGEEKRKPFILVLLVATIIMTVSSSAIWIMAIILVIYLISIRKISVNVVLIAPIAVFAVIALLYLFDFSFITDSLNRLFSEINTENTSTFERIKSPIEYVKATMTHYPFFGRGFGQEGFVDEVGQIGQYKGVNNSIFGSFVTLGLTAIVYYAWLVMQFFGKYGKKNIITRVILLFVLFGMYFATGAFLAFDTFIFLVIVLMFLSTIEKERGNA
ncbi:MAG: hypothetical protein J6A90_01880 [Clostridia bacterium]|nr:hypothetical protein [Clostridia bacterium]